jgi:parallel beta-helix repeat protein
MGFLGVLTFESDVVSAAGTTIYVDDDNTMGPWDGTIVYPYNTIQWGVDAASPGDTVFVYSGTYYENVAVNKSINLIGENKDKTIIDGQGINDTVYVSADWVNVSELSITNSGDNASPVIDAGIELYYVQNCRLFNIKVFNNLNGIYLNYADGNTIIENTAFSNNHSVESSGIRLDYSNLNSIINNTLKMNDGDGIYLYFSSGNTITGNNASNNNDDGIDITFSSNNIVENNTCISNGHWGIRFWGSNGNNIVINNTCLKNSDGICLHLSKSGNKIINNNASNNNGPWGVGIVLTSDLNDNIVVDNAVYSNNCGIYIWGLGNNDIISNKVLSNIEHGIYVWSSPNNNIFSNNVSNNANGIYITDSSDYNSIVDNNVSFNNGYGIGLSYSQNNRITGNVVNNNFEGINFTSLSANNVMTSNNISNNGNGIAIFYSHENTIINNTLYMNTWYGIDIKNDDNNTIYHNNFIDNNGGGVQARDNNGANHWNDNYPSGGNHWNDWTIPDIMSGPNQDIPGSDGFVDVPYSLDGGANATDYYPFTIPLEDSPPIITNLQPPDTSTTNDSIPTISADYSDPSGIDVSSVVLKVDGIDVTSSAMVTANNVSYIPGTVLSYGIHTIYLEVKDVYGNLATVSWSFTVDTAIDSPVNLTTKVVNNGNNIELEWDPSPSSALDHYLIYRADSATDFDFSTPYNSSTTWSNPINTTWVDPDPGVTTNDDFYYIVRAANFDESDISLTSNTAGVWTRTFGFGISTFSLPLEPFEARDVDFYCQDMDASYIKWMNQTTHTWVQHDRGDSGNNTLIKVGEGYEIGFLGKSLNHTIYTYTGMPGAMITYDDDILFSGFDPDTEAKNLTVAVEPDGNVTLIWQEPASMGPGDWYEVYYSNTRDGFFGALGIHYFLACPSISYGTNTTTVSGLAASDPGARLYFMVVPYNSLGVRGASTYSIGVWTEEYLAGYDTFGIPLKMSIDNTVDWYCDSILNTVGINYYLYGEQRWSWHSTRMPQGAYDTSIIMAEGYQISTSNNTKFTFIGI